MTAGKVFMTKVMLANLKTKRPPTVSWIHSPLLTEENTEMQSDWKRARLERLQLILAAGTNSLKLS